MLSIVPNNSFNDEARHVDVKATIHFTGGAATFYSDEHLVDMEVLEESGGEEKNPLGSVTANVLELTLSNEAGLFTPTNELSPYHGQFGVGTKIEVFICSTIDNLDINAETDVGIVWVGMGEFEVTNWVAKEGSLEAQISGADAMHRLLSRKLPRVAVRSTRTHTEIFEHLFEKLGMLPEQYSIDPALTPVVVPHATFLSDDTISMVLQDLADSAMCAVYFNRAGILQVKALAATVPVVTLTDEDQIVAVDTVQSILKTYDGVQLTYYRKQITRRESALVLSDLQVLNTLMFHGPYVFEEPMYRVLGVKSTSKSTDYIEIREVNASSYDILFKTGVTGNYFPMTDGKWSELPGQTIEDPNFRRTTTAKQVQSGTVITIHTGASESGGVVTALFDGPNGSLLFTKQYTVAVGGVLSMVVPESVGTALVPIVQGSSGSSENLLPPSLIANKSGSISAVSESGFTVTAAPTSLISSSDWRPLLEAGVEYEYYYDCEMLVDYSTVPGAVNAMPNKGLLIYSGAFSDIGMGMSVSDRVTGETWTASGTIIFDAAFIAAADSRLYAYSGRYDAPDGTRYYNELRISNLRFSKVVASDTETESAFACKAGVSTGVTTGQASKAGTPVHFIFYADNGSVVETTRTTLDSSGARTVATPVGATTCKLVFVGGEIGVGSVVTVTSPSAEGVRYMRMHGNAAAFPAGTTATYTFGEVGEYHKADVEVQGLCITGTPTVLIDEVANPLKIDNEFIQTTERAIEYKEKLTKFVSSKIPELTLDIRGNPLLEIGDTVLVQSAKYSTNYKGILKRSEYRFDGGLRCKVTLLDAEVLI